MSTAVSFDNMLKKYMPYKLLEEEMTKRDYLLMKIDKDQSWKGGEMQVPFDGGAASSIAYGQLTAEADIVEDRHVLGTVPGYKEIWGSMVFNDHDLNKHDSMEQSFIKILPQKLEKFLGRMKEAVSINLLNGAHIVGLDTAAGASDLANGIVVVDRPARLAIGQYLEFGVVGTQRTDGGTVGAYVKSINMSTKAVTFNDAKDLAGATSDLSGTGFNLQVGDKAFIRGAITAGNGFTSLRDQLLSFANGGSANLFGQVKLSYPILQAINHDGSGITAANLLDKVFDYLNETKIVGKGMPTEVIMSYKNLASAMKQLQGSVAYTSEQPKTNVYGWTEINVIGVKGQLKLVGIQEMDDDIMHILDWRSLKLHSNGFFERRTSPEGSSYYEVRATTGYKYIVDTRFFGELVCSIPSYNGIVYGISY